MDESLETRLARLERRYRQLKRLTGLVLVGAFLVITCAALQVEQRLMLRVNQLILEDQQHNTRGILSATNGNVRVALFGTDGLPRYRAEVNEDNQPSMTLHSSQNTMLASMAETDDGTQFRLHDDSGDPRFVINETDDGRFDLSLRGAHDKGEIRLEVDKNAAKILLYDQAKQERLQILCVEQMVGFGTKDTSGKQRLIISDILDTGPQIIIRNAQGEKVFVQPGLIR